MENEKRNRIMDGLLSILDDGDDGHFSAKSNQAAAIRECDRKARAWDELEKFVETPIVSDIFRDGPDYGWVLAAYKNVQEAMRVLLSPPQPKDPLEERVKSMPIFGHGNRAYVDQINVLAEIRRLRGAK